MINIIKRLFKKKESLAELCVYAYFTTDQLDNMGAKYMRLSMDTMKWGWHFTDGSKGYYDEELNFKVYK